MSEGTSVSDLPLHSAWVPEQEHAEGHVKTDVPGDATPLEQSLPGGHGSGVEVPAVEQWVLAGHGSGEDMPGVGQYEPTGQSTQVSLPRPYNPAQHLRQYMLPEPQLLGFDPQPPAA